MEKSAVGNERRKVRGHCQHARLLGVIGILILLWVLGYVIGEIPEEPRLAIPAAVFWIVMIAGALYDIIRIGKEGPGGLIVTIAGVVFYLFLLLKFVLGWKWERGGEAVELIAALPLFVAGLLFFLCGNTWKSKDPFAGRARTSPKKQE